MKVTVVYDNFQTGSREFTYFSTFDRINAKGIKEEAKNKLISKFGSHARNYEILNLYREEE